MGSRIVEFTQTLQVVDGERDGKTAINLKVIQIARVWPEDAPKRGKPAIVLMGADFPDLLECIRVWDSEGRPSIVEAKDRAQNGGSTA